MNCWNLRNVGDISRGSDSRSCGMGVLGVDGVDIAASRRKPLLVRYLKASRVYNGNTNISNNNNSRTSIIVVVMIIAEII